MDTNDHESKLLHKELVYAIVGWAVEVLNELGHGLTEKPYENALPVGCGLKGIAHEQPVRFDGTDQGRRIGEFIPDRIAGKAVVADTKVIDRITDNERGQMTNAFRITTLRVGVILNFQHSKLEGERLVL